jgi:tRNA nucleotidyltransferase/poly(A) polymerase
MKPGSRDAHNAALATIEKLRAAGHAALLAGGCVRDMLLAHEPKDYDVATDATPDRVHEIFPRSRRVGAKFGVMLVRKFGHDIEVATFRRDGPYSDGRHPDEVSFGTEAEDARRRDFTINGLFYDPVDERVIDHVGGRADLDAGIIRTIGDPHRRFAEDHLRMLRAVRFSARLGFPIEDATLEVMEQSAERLRVISAERIWLELEQILTAETRAAGWSLLVQSGLRQHLAPSWNTDAQEDALIQRRLAALPPRRINATLAVACVMAARTPGAAQRICRELRLSNRQTESTVWLIDSLPAGREAGGLELADVKILMANPDWPDLLALLRADLTATGLPLTSYQRLSARAAEIPEAGIAPPPLLGGGDLEGLGVPAGPQFGKILKAVYRAQLNEEIATREDAVSLARRLIGA